MGSPSDENEHVCQIRARKHKSKISRRDLLAEYLTTATSLVLYVTTMTLSDRLFMSSLFHLFLYFTINIAFT